MTFVEGTSRQKSWMALAFNAAAQVTVSSNFSLPSRMFARRSGPYMSLQLISPTRRDTGGHETDYTVCHSSTQFSRCRGHSVLVGIERHSVGRASMQFRCSSSALWGLPVSRTAAMHTRACRHYITLHYRASRSISHKTARAAARVELGFNGSIQSRLFRAPCIRLPL